MTRTGKVLPVILLLVALAGCSSAESAEPKPEPSKASPSRSVTEADIKTADHDNATAFGTKLAGQFVEKGVASRLGPEAMADEAVSACQGFAKGAAPNYSLRQASMSSDCMEAFLAAYEAAP